MKTSYYKYMYGDCSIEKEETIKETENFTKTKGTMFAKNTTDKYIYTELLKANEYNVNCFKCGFGYMIEYVK